jgi:hypothetical protein
MEIKVEDIKMNYEISGNENGSWLVMLHGTDSYKNYESRETREHNRNFKVLNIDLPGCTAQSLSTGLSRYNKIVTADYIRLFLDKLGIRRAYFAEQTSTTPIFEFFNEMFPERAFIMADAGQFARRVHSMVILGRLTDMIHSAFSETAR